MKLMLDKGIFLNIYKYNYSYSNYTISCKMINNKGETEIVKINLTLLEAEDKIFLSFNDCKIFETNFNNTKNKIGELPFKETIEKMEEEDKNNNINNNNLCKKNNYNNNINNQNSYNFNNLNIISNPNSFTNSKFKKFFSSSLLLTKLINKSIFKSIKDNESGNNFSLIQLCNGKEIRIIGDAEKIFIYDEHNNTGIYRQPTTDNENLNIYTNNLKDFIKNLNVDNKTEQNIFNSIENYRKQEKKISNKQIQLPKLNNNKKFLLDKDINIINNRKESIHRKKRLDYLHKTNTDFKMNINGIIN